MEPATLPPQPPVQPSAPRKITGRTKTALWLMIGPTALMIVAFLGYALINLAFATTTAATVTESAPFGEQTVVQTIANVLLFLVAVVTFLTWLPGLIIGIVLLATPKK